MDGYDAENHETHYYMLRKARYPESRAEDMRRREGEVTHSTAWALARSETVAWDLHGNPYSPTSLAQEGCECDESSGAELLGSDG